MFQYQYIYTRKIKVSDAFRSQIIAQIAALGLTRGHPHKPQYKIRTTLTHQTSLHLFFFFNHFFGGRQALPWPTLPDAAKLCASVKRQEFLFSTVSLEHIVHLFPNRFSFLPHVYFSAVTKLPTVRLPPPFSLHLHLSYSSPATGLCPGPNSWDFWHISSPPTKSFGTPDETKKEQ